MNKLNEILEVCTMKCKLKVRNVCIARLDLFMLYHVRKS